MLNNNKNSAFKTALFKGAFVHNSVLTQVIGICPILAAVQKISDAVCIGITLTILLVLNELLTCLVLKNIERWIRVAVYPLFSSFIIALSFDFLSSFTNDNAGSLGIYLYLLCVNALIVIRCEKFACKAKIKHCIFDAVSSGIGYTAVALIVGAVRQFFIQSSVSAVSSTFVALLILGFVAFLQKAVIKKYFPFEITNTFSLSACEEKPVLKDPGLGKKRNGSSSDISIRSRHAQVQKEDEDG